MLVLEVPLATLSYLLYKVFQLFWFTLSAQQQQYPSANWVDVLSKTVNKHGMANLIRGALCYGPRWNTHTNVHMWFVKLPPVADVAFEVENVNMHGFSWQINWRGGNLQQSLLASCSASPTGGDWIRVHVQSTSKQGQLVHMALRPYLFDGREEGV